MPACELAREHTGRAVANAALLGGFAALSGLISLDAVATRDPRALRGPVGERNVAAASAAHAWVTHELRELSGAASA